MQYLRGLFLNNDLADGRYLADGRPVHLSDIRIPVFAVGTVKDHVAPWRSVHKITFHPATDVTFLLTSGGHNAGIVSEPGPPRTSLSGQDAPCRRDLCRSRDLAGDHPEQEGSWWPAWQAWLVEQSSGRKQPPAMGAEDQGLPPLADAPGRYVLEA